MDALSERNELDRLLDAYGVNPLSNIAHNIAQQARVLRRLEKEESNTETTTRGKSSNFGPGIYNQRPTKFPSSCGACGVFIAVGTLCWVTVGDSPRCIKCGKP